MITGMRGKEIILNLWVSYPAWANVAGLNLIFFTPDEVLAYAECIPFTPDEVHILSIYSPLPNFFSPLPSCEPHLLYFMLYSGQFQDTSSTITPLCYL